MYAVKPTYMYKKGETKLQTTKTNAQHVVFSRQTTDYIASCQMLTNSNTSLEIFK